MNNVSKTLLGKIIFKGVIKTKTGLHIGASKEILEIGGVGSPVIREPITKEPYIPGSSIKGKLRSLLERWVAKKKKSEDPSSFFNRPVKGREIFIHACDTKESAAECEICRLFGSTAGSDEKKGSNFPSRLRIRDAYFALYTKNKFKTAETDYLYTEVKYENALDRVTAASNPRQIERVPPGSDFVFEIVYDVEDVNHLKEDLENLLFAISALEDDYIGGHGSRGYGKVKFYFSEIVAKKADAYKVGEKEGNTKKLKTDVDLEKLTEPSYEKLYTVDQVRKELQELIAVFKS